jgi:hypothetical protein
VTVVTVTVTVTRAVDSSATGHDPAVCCTRSIRSVRGGLILRMHTVAVPESAP